MESFAKKLNKNQLQAIKHTSGPLLIIAGAGTGKTTVITERIKHLISSNLAKPEEILALTYTEKGAEEMQTRVDEAMPLSFGDLWIMTFHSFCERVLRESAIHIGLDPKYNLMTTAESVDFLKQNLFEFGLDYFRPLGNPTKFLEGLLKHFSRLQDEDINPNEYLNWAKNLKIEDLLEKKKWIELSSAYQKYSELKVKNSLMDFADLITNTFKLFKERPNVLRNYQKKFKYILIDEFQDTNFIQNELVILLAGDDKNITVVADDDQAIYRWRGAAVSNVIQFKTNFPKAKIVVLTKNYRSYQEILDKSYNLIQHNNPNRLEVIENIDKRLKSALTKDKKDVIKFIYTQNSSDEAEQVCKLVIQLSSKPGYEYKDVAILVRANNHADSFIREFERKGIPHQFLGPSKLFEKDEIVDLISYLKVLYNPEDSVNLYRLLSAEIFDISTLKLIRLNNLAKRKSLSLFEIILEENDAKLTKIVEIINRHLKDLHKKPAGELLYDFVNEIGLLQKLIKNNDDVKAKNISKFFEKIKSYENENPKATVFDVVEYIDLLTNIGESPVVTDGDWQQNNAVNILTVHSSKGLEFPIVFMVNLVGDRFPSRDRREQIPIPDELIKENLVVGDFHLQEERRLFYVGMTRAKEKLFLTAARYYGDGKREKKISPFVQEAIGGTIISDMPYAVSKGNFGKQNYKTIEHKAESIKINFLSVSQIETFKTCPMHYKLKYIYKIPTPMSASISFGISIHETLKKFFESKEDIIKIYKESFLDEGYLNKRHKQEFYKKGESYLLGFLKNGFDPSTNTIELEKEFKMRLAKNLVIGGKIDRIDDLANGRYEVIDYKTGANISEQKEVDKDLQLSVYALVVSEMFNVAAEKIKLSLYFLDTQEKITTTRTTKQLKELKNEILEIRKEIEESDFKCNDSYFCQQGCEFKMFCKSDKVN